MIKVLVLSDIDNLKNQIGENMNKDIVFVFDIHEDYDFVVVLDDAGFEFNCKVPKAHRLLYIGEPPFIKPYTRSYLCQFGFVSGCSFLHFPNFQHRRTILPWRAGIKNNLNYGFFKTYIPSSIGRRNKFCIITSNKRFTPGHRKRVNFVTKLRKEHPELIDLYGNGFLEINDKFDILSKYRFCLSVENCVYPDYWTEKLSDALLCGCYPYYYGCPNIHDYFSNGSLSVVDISDYSETVAKMRTAINTNDDFQTKSDFLQARKFILDKYNLFQVISKDVKDILSKDDGKILYTECSEDKILPYRYTLGVKIKQKLAWKFNIIFS